MIYCPFFFVIWALTKVIASSCCGDIRQFVKQVLLKLPFVAGFQITLIFENDSKLLQLAWNIVGYKNVMFCCNVCQLLLSYMFLFILLVRLFFFMFLSHVCIDLIYAPRQALRASTTKSWSFPGTTANLPSFPTPKFTTSLPTPGRLPRWPTSPSEDAASHASLSFFIKPPADVIVEFLNDTTWLAHLWRFIETKNVSRRHELQRYCFYTF